MKWDNEKLKIKICFFKIRGRWIYMSVTILLITTWKTNYTRNDKEEKEWAKSVAVYLKECFKENASLNGINSGKKLFEVLEELPKFEIITSEKGLKIIFQQKLLLNNYYVFSSCFVLRILMNSYEVLIIHTNAHEFLRIHIHS